MTSLVYMSVSTYVCPLLSTTDQSQTTGHYNQTSADYSQKNSQNTADRSPTYQDGQKFVRKPRHLHAISETHDCQGLRPNPVCADTSEALLLDQKGRQVRLFMKVTL